MSTRLTAINQQTEWFDLTPVTSDAGFILEGDFDTAVSVHYSNKQGTKSTNDYVVDPTTYSTKVGIVVAFGVARYVRFASGVSWSSGKVCTIRPGLALAGDKVFVPTPQESTNIPTGD